MLDNHRQIIERLTQQYRADPDVLALIVQGSVARGDAHEHSDVDALAILTDEGFERYRRSDTPPLSAAELVGQAGVDTRVGIWGKSYLRAAAVRAPEPTRFAFIRTIVPFCHDPEIEQLLAEIPRYPEHERQEKMASFASQLPVHMSYLYLGDYSENAYILTDTSHELALFGGRLILAHNRLLYPGRKHFLKQLEQASERPDRFMWLMHRMLRRPSIPTAEELCEAVLSFREWPQPAEGHGGRYLRDRDEAWLHRPAALAES